MKRQTFSLLILTAAVLVLSAGSWATCPEAPNDAGLCDTLRITSPDGVQTGAGPWLIRFPIFITHDLTTWFDSIGAMVLPFCYTNTNPAKFCSVNTYWNRTLWTQLQRSIFRDLGVGNDTSFNWMMGLYNAGNGEEWNSVILDVLGGNSGHFFLTIVPTGTEDRRFEGGNHVLMATMTFKIQDTMHVSIDTCWWSPSSNLAFAVSDSHHTYTYIPRTNLPTTFWIGPPRLQVTSPNGGEQWAQGSSHNITWLSENFTGTTVKIEYSTNSGSSWNTVIASTANSGTYAWTVPGTPSALCLVRITNTGGATPTDVSDAVFEINAPPSPDFSIAATPDTQTIVAGDSTTYSVNLGSVNGFSNPVTLSMSVIGASTGITSNFTSNPVTPPGASTMKVHTTTSTAVATYKLEVTGTYSSIVHKDTVNLKVTPVPDFTIRAEPGTREVVAGDSAKYNVILKYLNGFNKSCDLTATGLPTGATAVFRPTPLVPPDTLSIMTVYTTAGVTPAGTSDITITATSAAKVAKQVHVSLVVHVPDFTLDATPETLTVRQSEQGNYNIALVSLYGFSSPCSLTVSGLPANVSAVYTPGTVTPTGSSTLAVSVDLAAVPDKYPLIITGTKMGSKGTVLAHSDTVLLNLTSQKDFDLAVIPDTLHIALGEKGSYKVRLIPISGYDLPCSLTVSGFTSGITGSFAKPLLTPEDSTTLDISVSCSVTPSSIPHTLTITATESGGTLKHSKDVELIVDMGTWSFAFATQPDTQKAVVGDSAVYQVLIRRQPCFLEACTLSIVNGLPAGASYYFNPTIIPGSDSTSHLVVSSGIAASGVYHLIVKGKALVKPDIRDTLIFVVQDFSVSSSQDTAIVTKGQSAGISITVNSLLGFAEQCTLMVSVSVKSNPPNCVLDKVTLIPTDNAFLNIYTATETDTGWYDITITARRMTPGKAFVLEHSHHIALKVNESSDVNDGQDNPNIPGTFTLFQNQPNPFNPITQISYYLPKACQVKLTVYNVLGQAVKVLYDGYQDAGMQNVTWDGKSANGNELSSGIYFYRLKAGDFNQTKKMSLMK